MDDLKRQLTRLRAIEPDRGFAARSRAAILAERRRRVLVLPRISPFATLAGALALAAIAAFAIVLHPFAPARTSALSSLEDTQALTQELDDLNINIQLQDISYQTSANQTVAAAITEIAGTQTKHLNTGTLQSEQQSTEPSDNTNPEIDKLLNTITL